MKILLVNDDGFYSEGIKILDDVLSLKGHEVWVCAPEIQRSACSHAITMYKPVRIHKEYERHYTCDGFPADCALFSILGAIPMGKPDLVISGINQGFNFSTDVVYSATVAGANEGALKGIPSIALSCETVVQPDKVGELPKQRNFETFPFKDAANFIADNLDKLYSTFEIGSFLNINVPDNANGVWKVSTIGRIEFYDEAQKLDQDDYFQLRGTAFPDLFSKKLEDTDYYTLFVEKKISITALKTKLKYNEKMQEKLSKI